MTTTAKKPPVAFNEQTLPASAPHFPSAGQSQMAMKGEAPVSTLSTGDLLRAVAAEAPQRVALMEPSSPDGTPGRRWTYAQLLAEAEAGARALLQSFEVGEHVAVWCSNRPEWVILEFAAGLAGVVLVTANPTNRITEIQYVLEQSRSVGLFYNQRYRDIDAQAIVTELRPRLPSLRHAFSMESWADFVASAPGESEQPLPEVSSEAPAMIQYTSGTTGKPKGAVLPHRSLVNCGRFSALELQLKTFPRWYIAVPLFHTGGCVFGVLGAVWQRGAIIVAPEFDPHRMLDAIALDGANGGTLVPTMCLRLLDAQAERPRDIKNLQVIVGGGTSVPPALVGRIERELGAEFVMVFGQTETGSAISQSRRGDTEFNRTETVGRLYPNLEVRIVAPETGETVPLGTQGEICLRGYMGLLEYYAMPEASRATLDADGWVHTGDLGTLMPNGYLTITGRLKDTIIRGGEKIFPRELETVIGQHASVAEVAVFGVPDAHWGEVVVAAIRLKPGVSESPEALGSWLRERVARYKVPQHITFVDQFPLTPSGKVQKFVMRDAMVKKLEQS